MRPNRLLAATAVALAALCVNMPAVAQPKAPRSPDLALWRLDCGTIQVSNLDVFSDSFLYPGKSKTLTDSCYLIKHGADYMLWDTGLPASTIATPVAQSGTSQRLRIRLVDQLARIGVRPATIRYVGISHSHGDHIGQAADFGGATLLMGQADFDAVAKSPNAQARLAP